MTANTNRLTNWMPLALLVVLGLLPLLPAVGRMVVRFADVGAPPEMLADTSRFFVMPVPVAVHIVSACLFTLVGALQFSKTLRRSRWHRLSGRVLVIAGVLAAGSGLWLTNFYPPLGNEGPLLYFFRTAAGLGMLWFLVQGYLAARRRWLFCMIIAGIQCAFVPLGTVLGIFTLIVLQRDSVRRLFPASAS